MKPPSKKKLIKLLKEVKNIEELNSVMSDIKVPYTKGEGNRFGDNIWIVRKSAKGEYKQVDFSSYLDPFPMAVCKVYFFLNMYGYLGVRSKNAANIATNYRLYARELCAIQPGIFSLTALQKEDIDLLASNNSKIQAKSCYSKLIPFIKAANLTDTIPSFLRISKAAFGGAEYLKLEDRYFEESRARDKPGNSPRPPYPFEDLALMMPVAFELITHSDSLLDLVEHLKDANYFSVSYNYKIGCMAIKTFKKKTGDPKLDLFIEQIQSAKTLHRYENGKHMGPMFGGIKTKMDERIKLIESASVIVVLTLSAMRRGELARLSRKLELDNNGDEMVLVKTIFKTSASTEGDTHTIPMPEIGVRALKFLSRLATLRDDKKEGGIITLVGDNTDYTGNSSPDIVNRINDIVKKLPASLNLTPLTPHQLRHVMAYLVMNVVGKEGLDVVRYLLGHTSILMTLTYLSRVNPFFREALEEITKIQSKENLEAMYANMQKGKKVYGAKSASFNGIVDNDMIEIMFEYWGDKIEQGWMMILLTPMAMCVHDLNNPGEMKCQRGLDTSDLVGAMPAPARCNPDGCSSALYLEDHVVKVMALAEDANQELQNDEMFQRLGKNLYFNPDDFSIEKESGFKSIIDEYLEDQRKAI